MNQKIQNLFNALAALQTHASQLQAFSNVKPEDIDTLTNAVTVVDTEMITILTAPPPPKPVNIDFTVFDAAVAAFKADGRLSQQDVDNVANVLSKNTP